MTTADDSTPCGEKPRPPLRWPGGKRTLASRVLSNAGTIKRYIEPFLGGGAVFLHGLPRIATLSDKNEHLMNMYTMLQWDPDAVIAHLRTYENTAAFFYQTREKGFRIGSPAERAADLIYLQSVNFNGLYRENKLGKYNVPFGDNSGRNFCDEKKLIAVAQALQGVDLQCGDFEGVVASAQAGDFVYADPPYIPLSATSNFTNYTADGFTYDHHVRLRDAALKLKSRGVQVVLSNSSAPAVLDLYKTGFEIEFVYVRRNINSKADGRGPVKEVLIR